MRRSVRIFGFLWVTIEAHPTVPLYAGADRRLYQHHHKRCKQLRKILTHKVGDLAKNFALSLMLIVFVVTLYVPAGIILLIADLLLIPGLWLSFRMVRKYGKEKNDICAENVSSIVEYVSGIQTFRAYGVGGMKNKTVINAMREFCRISFIYEAKVLPIGAGFGILSWLSCPLVIWLSYAPWIAGTLNTVDYL